MVPQQVKIRSPRCATERENSLAFFLVMKTSPSSISRIPTSWLRLLPRITGTPLSAKKREPMADPKGPVAKALGADDFRSFTVHSVHSAVIPKFLQSGGDG